MPAVSQAKQDARLPAELRAAFQAVARQHGRSASEELRLALHMWVILASVAANLDRDVAEALEPSILDGRMHDFRLAATNHIGDAFQTAAPEAILATLAPEHLEPSAT